MSDNIADPDIPGFPGLPPLGDLIRVPIIFPIDPQIGDDFDASNGVRYRWDGAVWTKVALDLFVLKAGDTMVGDLTIRTNAAASLNLVGATTDFNQPITFRIGVGSLPGDPGYRFVYRISGQPGDLGLTLHRDAGGPDTVMMRVPLQEDHVDFRHPRTVTGDAINADELVRLAQINAMIGDIDRFVLKSGDDLTGPLRWNTPANGEAIQITHGVIRVFGGAIDVQAGIDAADNFGSEVRANWFVVPTDGRGLAFGTLGQDGGLYKAVGSGLRLRQSSGNQRIAIEPNDGSEQWAIIDQRGGELHGGFDFYREGTASIGGQTLQWHDDTSLQARAYGTRYAGSDDLGGFLIQLWRPDTAAWQTGLRVRQSLADPIPRVELAGDPLLPMDAATRQYVDRLASGAPHFIGTIDAATGICSYTPNSGHPDGPLVDPADAASGAFLICTNGGNDPSLPGPMEQGDWLVTDGNIWTVLHLAIGAITASNVGLQPPVFGQANVQLALQESETLGRANETAITERVARAGDTMTGFLTLSGAPTLPLHAATRGYIDTVLSNLRLPTWTQGANYVVGQAVLYDNRAFTVTTAINNAPATPVFTTITPTGYGQSDYWHGDVNIANWEAGNWAYICDLPAYGAYRLAISDLHASQDTSILFDIVTGFNLATATLIGHTHQGTGSWSALRLSQTGNASVVRVDLQIGIRSGTPNLKVIVTGEARGTIVNGVRIQKPPTAAVAVTGTERARIPNLRVLSLATSGSLAAQGAAPFIRLNSDTNTSGRATLEFGTAAQDQFQVYRNSGAGGLYFDATDDAGTTRNAMHIIRADGHLEMDSGLRFGSVAQTSPQDLTRHIALWGGATPTANGFGFSITGGTLNHVTGNNNAHDFHAGPVHLARLNSAGLSLHAGTLNTRFDNASNAWNLHALIVRHETATGGVSANRGQAGIGFRNFNNAGNGGDRQASIALAYFGHNHNGSGDVGQFRFLRADGLNLCGIAAWSYVTTLRGAEVDLTEMVDGLDQTVNAVRLAVGARAFSRVRSEGADAGIGNNPPTLRANSNSIHVANANWTSPLFLPNVDYLAHGEAFFFESQATNNTVIQTARTSMTAALTLTTNNTAVFANNRRTNLWDYVGTISNAALPPANKVNVLGNSYTLPANRGTNGQAIVSNGAGGTAWGAAGVPGPSAWETHTASAVFAPTRLRTRLMNDGTAQIEARMQFNQTPSVDQPYQVLTGGLPLGKRPPYTYYCNVAVSRISAANFALIALEISNTTGAISARTLMATTPITSGDPISFNFTYPVV